MSGWPIPAPSFNTFLKKKGGALSSAWVEFGADTKLLTTGIVTAIPYVALWEA